MTTISSLRGRPFLGAPARAPHALVLVVAWAVPALAAAQSEPAPVDYGRPVRPEALGCVEPSAEPEESERAASGLWLDPWGGVPAPRTVTDVFLRTRQDHRPEAISILCVTPEEELYLPLCTTPCHLQLRQGTHWLRAGDAQQFEVDAQGGRQEWLVEDRSTVGTVFGAVLTFVGPIVLPLAGMAVLTGQSDEDDDRLLTGYSLIAGGVVVGLVGITLWILCRGESELISSAGGPAVALDLGSTELIPTLTLVPEPDGGLAWGFGLTLSL